MLHRASLADALVWVYEQCRLETRTCSPRSCTIGMMMAASLSSSSVVGRFRPTAKCWWSNSSCRRTRSPSLAKWLDLHMMVVPGGRERTAAEYEALFRQAGFALGQILPTPAGPSVVEAVPM